MGTNNNNTYIEMLNQLKTVAPLIQSSSARTKEREVKLREETYVSIRNKRVFGKVLLIISYAMFALYLVNVCLVGEQKFTEPKKVVVVYLVLGVCVVRVLQIIREIYMIHHRSIVGIYW